MSKLEEIKIKIEANKEILATLPKNNEKNVLEYLQKVETLEKEYKEYEEQILKEMKNRYKQTINVTINSEIETIKQQIEEIEKVLYLLNDLQSSYEKMGLNESILNLKYYYKKNLNVVNETIFYCIKKFEEVGITLRLEDFWYSKYVKEYLTIFFQEMSLGDISSDKIKSKFEEIYWKCPDIIIHIELNLRYIYIKYEKEIDKYYERRKQELLKDSSEEQIRQKYKDLTNQLMEKNEEDKYNIITSFLEKRLTTSDYSKDKIKNIYERYITLGEQEEVDDDKAAEISSNMKKLLDSIYEYKNYLKYQFVIENIKQVYKQRDKYKNIYEQTKKEIVIKESNLAKINDKINGKGLFKKPDEAYLTELNNLILEIKELYRELDKHKVYTKIYAQIKDITTVSETLYFAGSFYNYIWHCIRDEHKDYEEDAINNMIEELQDFLNWPYCNLLNNIEMLAEKNILLIIKDRYNLLGINITEAQLEESNLEILEMDIKKLVTDHNIRKNKINVEELTYICEFKKILEN